MLAIILTVRLNSNRLPNKAMVEIRKKPLVYWIIKRLQKINDAQVILATTRSGCNDELLDVAKSTGIEVYYGSENDVVERVDHAWKELIPSATHIFRALGDCPFIDWGIIQHAYECMSKYDRKEAFLWHLPAEVFPVYGSREFPYSRSGWQKLFLKSSDRLEREHVDLFFHRNRRLFDVLYHQPPHLDYFRPDYRLEVDYPEDVEMVQEIGNKIGMLAELRDVIKFLDENEEVSRINRGKVELTGPSISYNFNQKRIWHKNLAGKNILKWDGGWVKSLTDLSKPVFCGCGEMLGYGQWGVLYTKTGDVIEKGTVRCGGCGSKTVWDEAIE